MKTKQFIVRWRQWRRQRRRRWKESNSSLDEDNEEDDEKKPIHLKEDKEDGYWVIDVDEYKDHKEDEQYSRKDDTKCNHLTRW